MREVDRRSKYDRRVFLKGAATAVPVAAVATSTGLSISGAWADEAATLHSGSKGLRTQATLQSTAARSSGRSTRGNAWVCLWVSTWVS